MDKANTGGNNQHEVEMSIKDGLIDKKVAFKQRENRVHFGVIVVSSLTDFGFLYLRW